MTKSLLTKRQLELFRYIEKQIHANGFPPSFDEMKEAMGLKSKSGIHRMIEALVERGYITRLNYRARSIAIASEDVTTARAIEIVLSRCKLNKRASEELAYLLACERGVAGPRGIPMEGQIS